MLSVARRPVRAGRERRRRLSRGLVEREVLPFLFFSLLVTIFTHDKLTYAGSEVSGKTVSPPLAHSWITTVGSFLFLFARTTKLAVNTHLIPVEPLALA